MLQSANTDIFNPLATKAHNSAVLKSINLQIKPVQVC